MMGTVWYVETGQGNEGPWRVEKKEEAHRDGLLVVFDLNGRNNLDSAKEELERHLHAHSESWIFPGHTLWTFDLETLAKSYPQLSGLEWLKGRPEILPEIKNFPLLCDPETGAITSQEAARIEFYVDRKSTMESIIELVRPAEIRESLRKFQKDYPDPSKVAFIMMSFGKTNVHKDILQTIKTALRKEGITGLRADKHHKQYHDDLLPNVLTHIFGCGLGVAVFEDVKRLGINPNVAFEVGYMLSLQKPVCLLKDKKIKKMPADILSKLYKQFDCNAVAETIPPELEKWLADMKPGVSRAVTTIKSRS